MKKAKIGVIGLGVMGANLARNFANHGIGTVVFNRTTANMEAFIAEYGNDNLMGALALEEFMKGLEKPRRIMLMVNAGAPVDQVIETLRPHLEGGDIVIDGGNSHYRDTMRREKTLSEKGIYFMGCGVSGGEEGALKGPSLMPGGSMVAWKNIQLLLETIAARDFSGGPCVTYLGSNGVGHYVKMVHNGIEYAVMQCMAESYDLLRKVYGLNAAKIAEIFKNYNSKKLGSFLFEIAAEVLSRRDDLTDGYLIDHILDSAAQKGTGRWTVMDAIERSVPIGPIAAAVEARMLSGMHRGENLGENSSTEKISAPDAPDTPNTPNTISLETFVATLGEALLTGIKRSYERGFALLRQASEEEGWKINLSEVARIWQGGCIIRTKVLKEAPHFPESANNDALRAVITIAAQNRIPVPALSSALALKDTFANTKTPANFIQALRDRFGAHTYQRTDRDGTFHTEWT